MADFFQCAHSQSKASDLIRPGRKLAVLKLLFSVACIICISGTSAVTSAAMANGAIGTRSTTDGVIGSDKVLIASRHSTLKATPTPDKIGTSRRKVLSSGNSHTCVISSDGAPKCWGANDLGQLGNNKSENVNAPVAVVRLNEDVTAIASGLFATCAISSQGGLFCWGGNDMGELGNGTTIASLTPLPVHQLYRDVDSVAVGGAFACALLDSGAIKCWGFNLYGQLGNDSDIDSSVPVSVKGLETGGKRIASGVAHACAVMQNGAVRCWGYNRFGQLASRTKKHSKVPTTVLDLDGEVTDLVAGSNHTCVLMMTRRVKCWGYNKYGQLGNGTFTDSGVPVDVVGLPDKVTAISAGQNHTCALLLSGEVHCWGENSQGSLGNGNNGTSLSPQIVKGLKDNVIAISCGGGHTCALTREGRVLCWGSNVAGQLGNGTWINSNIPVEVVNLRVFPATNPGVKGAPDYRRRT